MSSLTKNGTPSTKRTAANGTTGKSNGLTPKGPKEAGKADEAKIQAKNEQQPKATKQELTIEQLAMQKLEKQTKLESLFTDVQALKDASRELDAIKSSADLEIIFKAREGVVFRTTKSDTVAHALKAVHMSVKAKEALAQQKLVEFEF